MSDLRVSSVPEYHSHRVDNGQGQCCHYSMAFPTEDGTEWNWHRNPFVVIEVAPIDLVDLEWLCMNCSRHSNY